MLLTLTTKVVFTSIKVVQKTPVLSHGTSLLLDIIFGRPEDFEYVSTTAPAPPPHSQNSGTHQP